MTQHFRPLVGLTYLLRRGHDLLFDVLMDRAEKSLG